ncbi:multidrug resistance protein MdtC [Clostridium puniceum]|uniref:Multidrug resistance protein MdtC n=1 Tax=Clostridium puniceum TaxID=29367 RepID=A0A1S8TDA5_9CLOT|nr:efflux RND transporter permease subunit [Clostridium puniceum]OOM75599.1 multidrug resistance protein MdtC [Clostridium puniceum]
MNIANLSIKKPVFITVIMIALTILGYTSYQKLVLNDMPNVDMPYVSVMIIEPGATPEQIESKVTKKIEDAVGKISGIDTITSTVSEGSSQTTIAFELSKDGEVAAQEVRDKISTVRGELPTDINDPIISKFDMSASSILSIAVYGSNDTQKMTDFIDNTLNKKLYTVSGVGSVDVSGEDTREIHIKLDNDKLLSYGLSPGDVINSIKKDNIDQSTGKVVDGNNEISITTNSKIKKIEDFKNILVTKKNDAEIRVKDVAKIEDGFEEKSSIAYYQGNQAIGIDIVKQSGANTVEVAKDVKQIINEIKASLPEGIQVDIVSDNSTSIEESVDEVMKTIIEGCILAVIIVFLFLNEWESTLISALSLPISVISTFICMKFMNFSLNSMSLMALSLAVGLLIDDAIVVIENIVRHLHMGKSAVEAAKEATSEIGFAVIATTLAVISVFFPMAMVEGMVGKFIIEFALTVVFSMIVSLFVSFTLVPMMSSKMLKGEKKESKTFIGKFFKWFNEKFDIFAEKYSQLLVLSLNKRLLVLGISGAMFVGSIGLGSTLGFESQVATDNGQVNVSAAFDSGITLDNASEKTKQFEAVISKYPEVKFMYSTVSKSKTSIKISLVDKKQRKDSSKAIAEKLRSDLQGISGAQVTVTAASGAGGGSKDVAYNIVGDDRTKLQAFANKMAEEMSKDPNARDVSTNSKSGTPQVRIEVDRDKAADLGVSSSDVASMLSTLFNGSTVSKYDGGKDRYDVKISIDDSERKNLNDLNNIYVLGTKGQQVPLSQVTKKVVETTSSSLHRYNKQPQVEVSANVTGISSGTFESNYKAKIQSQLPDGVSLSVGGTSGMMAEGMQSLMQAIFLAILFLYLVMAAQFESFIDPISIMFALPLAIIGAVIGLFVFGSSISMICMVGIIMLMGLVAKNGILLIDSAKEKMKEGIPIKEALREAGYVRLRPIVMTTLAMIFGMIPAAIATGSGSESRAPMAQAIIGGLITSSVLTLFVVPIAYTILDDLKNKFNKLVHKKSSKIDDELNSNL